MEKAILALLANARNGQLTEDFCKAFQKTPQELGDIFESLKARGDVLGFAGLWYDPAIFDWAQGAFLESLRTLHQARPDEPYHLPEEVAKGANLEWKGKPLARIVGHFATAKLLIVSERGVKLPGFSLRLTKRQQDLLIRVVTFSEGEEWAIPASKEIASQLEMPVQAVTEILRLGNEAGETIWLAPNIYFLQKTLAKFSDLARSTLGDSPFTASVFRQSLGVPRLFVVPLLEYLDRTGVTISENGKRRLNGLPSLGKVETSTPDLPE